MYQAGQSAPLFGRWPAKEDKILLHTTAQAVASNVTAARTIHDALIDAGVDLERARADSAVYYPDLVPQVARVATKPEVIDAVRSIQREVLTPGGDAGPGAEIDACDVVAIILRVTFLAASSAPIL
jgi:hypothetical protein